MSTDRLGAKGIAVFDERRNSSRVWPVSPLDVENATKALASFRSSDPALHAWISDGAPRLTHDDHFARFGEPYRATRSKRLGGSS